MVFTSQSVLPGQLENFLLFVATNNVDRVESKENKEQEETVDDE